MRRPFIERAISRWLEGCSVLPLIPHSTKPYPDVDVEIYESRQPSLRELYEWSQKYPGAGVGIVVEYRPNWHKTLQAIREMDLEFITDIPVFILIQIKDFQKRNER